MGVEFNCCSRGGGGMLYVVLWSFTLNHRREEKMLMKEQRKDPLVASLDDETFFRVFPCVCLCVTACFNGWRIVTQV